jgi:hypothetical protein
VRSALGTYDPSIYYEWTPLYQPDPKELADIAFSKAQATNLDVQMALINEDALRAARINQLIEDGTYPGLDDAVDEFGAEPPEPTPEELAAYTAMMQGNSSPSSTQPPTEKPPVVQDSAPRTLYVRRDVLNAAEIIEWAKSQGIAGVVPASEMHVTVTYSRMPVDWMVMGDDYGPGDADGGRVVVQPGGPRMLARFGRDNDYVVLMFNNWNLRWRHDTMVEKGASWDWPEYQPHVTIAMGADADLDLDSVEPYRGQIVLGPEIFEEIKE